jgi:glycosyltransferase involved in cell wall biosynthesis
MRIAYVITRADEIGGAQVHVRDLASAMHQAGHEVAVVAGNAGELSAQLMRRGVPFHCVPALVRELRPWRDLKAFLELKGLLARLRPELVSTHSSKAGWLGRLAARALGIPALFTAHGWAFTVGVSERARRFYALAERLAAPLADRIVTVSEYDRSLAVEQRIALPDKIVRIYNGVHDCLPCSPALLNGAGVRLVMTGRFTAQKDHARLLHALAGLRYLDWTLDLIGNGPLQAEAIALAGSLGLRDRVHFLGARNDVCAVLRGADVYVLVSNWEGLPRSILEAMSVSLPVVASDVGGVSEVVREAETGFVVPRQDDRCLAERLRLLIAEGDLRRNLGTCGRRRYDQEFRFEVMFERTFALYQEMLAGVARARS